MQVPGKGWRLGQRREPWRRGPAALTADGWIEIAQHQMEAWTPQYRGDQVGPGDLLVELAAIKTPDDARVFAQQYGLLYPWPTDPDQPWRQHWDQWDQNAAVLRLVLGLYEDTRAAMAGSAPAAMIRAKWEDTVRQGYPGRNWDSDEQFLRDAAIAVADIVSASLEGTDERLAILADGDRPVMWVFDARTPDLLTTIYHQVALLVTASIPLRACADAECRRWFSMTDPRQRYCSPAHAARVRQRRRKEVT